MLHFLQDFQYHSISSLSLVISLWVIQRGPLVFNVVCLHQAPYILVYKRGTIVTDQTSWDTKLRDDVLMNEV